MPFSPARRRVRGAITRRLGSSSSPRVSGENSMRSSFRRLKTYCLCQLWGACNYSVLPPVRRGSQVSFGPALSSDPGAALALRIGVAVVGIVAGERTPHTDALRWGVELALAGDRQRRPGVHRVRALERGGQDNLEIARGGIRVAGAGLFAPPV